MYDSLKQQVTEQLRQIRDAGLAKTERVISTPQGARIAVAGQPVFVMARPDGRQIWVNFALPDNGTVQVIDSESNAIVRTLQPGKAVLHLEFTPRGEAVWLSARDDQLNIDIPKAPDRSLEIAPIGLYAIYFGFAFLLPALLLGFGVARWVVRRRK